MTTVEEWISHFKNKVLLRDILKNDYGDDYKNFKSKQKSILDLLDLHNTKFGNEDIIIIRSPGRINLMGRHIDHQGGNVNLIAIDQEIFLTASLRNDAKIIAYNIDVDCFPRINLNFDDCKATIQGDWVKLINMPQFINKFRSNKSNWNNYIAAAFLKLANSFDFNNIKGANICVSGDIIIAAGLSSSSALTMGILEALINLNKIRINDKDIINLCAEAEWFVGTRGGSADHVAIKLAKLNKIAHVRLFELEVLDYIDFPKNYNLLIFNSHIIAEKSGTKKDIFNERVLAYEVGFNLIKIKLPQYSHKLRHLRDINPDNLDIKFKELIEVLMEIPEYLSIEEISEILGQKWEEIKKGFQFQVLPKKLPIRKVIAYGISECERSKTFYNLVKKGDLQSAGELMNISHDGDRIKKYNISSSEELSFNNELDNTRLKEILESKVSLDHISGGYGCSIPEIDYIVDYAKQCEGVLGAQLSGAGMGGCAMILVEKDKSEEIQKLIYKNYQERFKKSCSVYLSHSVNGLSLYSNP